MNIGQALGQLAVGAGNNLIYGAQYNQQVAQTENTKSNTQLHQMEALAMQQSMDDRKALATDVATEMQASGTGMKTQQEIGKIATYAAGKAFARGDLAGAQKMEAIAQNSQVQQKEQMVQAAAEAQQKKETAASTAADFLVNPTPETAQALVKQAIQTGADPSKIPFPSDPKFQSWAKEQSLAAIPSAERLKFVQEAKKTEEAHAEKVREFDAREKDRAVQRQMLAEQREQNNLFKKEQLALMRERAADRRTAAAGKSQFVKTHPAQVESGIQMIVGSAGEAMNAFDNILDMPATVTSSMFADLAKGTVPEALMRGGAQRITPEDQKVYDMFTGGLSTEMTRVLTGGGGRSGGQQLADELKKTLRVEPTDSKQMAMVKTAYGVQMLRNRLHYLAKSDDPSFAPMQEELKAKVANFPSPGALLKKFQTDPTLEREFSLKAPTLGNTMQTVMGAVAARDKEVIEKGKSAAPALPEGWK